MGEEERLVKVPDPFLNHVVGRISNNSLNVSFKQCF